MTADTVGGVWQFTMELCRALSKAGDSVALATMGAMVTPAQRREAESIAGLELHPGRHRLEWMESPWQNVDAAGDWLLEIAAQFRPHVAHLNQFSFGALPWDVPVVMTGHSCVLSWWRAVHGTDAPVGWRDYQERVQRGLHGASLVVAPTRSMLDSLELHYGPLPPSRVIANGRTLEATPSSKEAAFILAAGRLWDAGKNLQALADVAPELPWPICVAGDSRHPDGGQVQLPNLRLLGQLGPAELGSWFARAPIYALPARYEPFGLSVLEAALAGCALVLGDIPSLREVWGESALYVPADDHDALRSTLRGLIDDAGMRDRLGMRAHVRARRYSAAAMAQAYRRAYADVALAATPLPRRPQAHAARTAAGGPR